MKAEIEFDDRRYLIESPGCINIRVNVDGRYNVVNIGTGSDDAGEELARIPLGGDWEILISKTETDLIERFLANYSKELIAEVEINNIKYCLYK